LETIWLWLSPLLYASYSDILRINGSQWVPLMRMLDMCRPWFTGYEVLKALRHGLSNFSEWSLSESDVLFHMCTNWFIRIHCPCHATTTCFYCITLKVKVYNMIHLLLSIKLSPISLGVVRFRCQLVRSEDFMSWGARGQFPGDNLWQIAF